MLQCVSAMKEETPAERIAREIISFTGGTPIRFITQRQFLEERLQKALKAEDYNHATELRDELAKLKKC
jgi:protein-arginine kinase activator protein McsA